MIPSRQIKLLDCTLRDGGYYNKWKFSKNLINKYLKAVKDLNIRYIEIGFRKFKDDISLGETAYSTEKFINSLNLPKKISYGVMVNMGDLISNGKLIKNYKLLFPNNSRIEFVRLACHEHEIFLTRDVIKFLKSRNYQVYVNLMQISEMSNKNLNKILNYINKTNLDIFYIADSFGALSTKRTKEIIKFIKSKFSKEIGIHAHDNLGLALKNTLNAINFGATWVDSTVMGMGRGPGNTKTEEIIYKLNKTKIKDNLLKNLISNDFLKLKKKYKWGKNIYYYKSAKYKIHPTFVQEILSDERIKKSEKMDVINFLKDSPSKKFNPNLIRNFIQFRDKKIRKGRLFPANYYQNKKLLLVGNGIIHKNKLIKIKKLIKNNQVNSMSINLNKNLNTNLIDTHIFAHPLRFKSQFKFINKIKGKVVFPTSYLEKKKEAEKILKKSNIFNYDLNIKNSNNIVVNKEGCDLPSPLGLGYGMSLAISRGCKEIMFAGIDIGKNKSFVDNSSLFIKLFKKNYKKIKFNFL